MLCFPRNLKGSVPGVPDANLVQLFKSLLGQAFQHQSLESPWTSLEDPWRVPGSSLEVPGGPWWVPGGSLEGPWNLPGGPWRIPGGSLEAPWSSLRVPGGSLGGPWRSLEGPWRVPGGPWGSLMQTLFSSVVQNTTGTGVSAPLVRFAAWAKHYVSVFSF